MPILSLMPMLRRHFDPLEDRLTCFCKYGCQLEAWFKGELLTCLHRALQQGAIQELDREVSQGGKRIDLMIRDRNGTANWIELKHWLIGQQREMRYDANFYFGDPSSVGISQDVRKLASVVGARSLLILMTANPGKLDWESGVTKFNSKFHPLQVEAQTQSSDFPDSYFLGVLRVP